MNLCKNFLDNCENNPFKIFIVNNDTKKNISYSQALNEIIQIFNLLSKIKEKRIGLLFQNNEDFILTILASILSKKCVIPLNYNIPDKDNLIQLKKFGIKILIHSSCTTGLSGSGVKKINIRLNKNFRNNFIHKKNVDILKKININFNNNFDFLVSSTSGSTGKPKGILCSLKTKFLRAKMLIDLYKIEKSQNILISTPIYHTLAFRLVIVSFLNSNKLIVTNFPYLNNLIECLKKYKIGFFITVSSQLRNLAHYPKSIKNTLKTIVSSSDTLGISEIKKLKKKFQCKIFEIFGASECSIISNVNLRLINRYLHKGKPIKNVRIKLLNNKKLHSKKNIVGEICVLSKYQFSRYLNETTSKFYFKKFFKTGDLGKFDSKGNLVFVDRKKSVFKVGAVNVFADDIITKLNKLKYINDTFVFPIKNKSLGNVVGVALKSSKKINLKKFYKFCEINLATYQIPHKVLFFKDFPRNSLGKIDRAFFDKYY